MIRRKSQHVAIWLLLSLFYEPLPTASFIVGTTPNNILTRINTPSHLNYAHIGKTRSRARSRTERESFRDNLISLKATNVIVDEFFDRNSSPAQQEEFIHDENKESINNEIVAPGIPSYTKLIIFVTTTIIIRP